jgi:hypothetical protein
MLKLALLPGTFAVCRLPAGALIPGWASLGPADLCSVTRTRDELSIVVDEARVPSGLPVEAGWKAFQIAGPLAFSLTGVIASLVGPLADVRIGVFVVSTFDTDYLLVKAADVERAAAVLARAGHTITSAGDGDAAAAAKPAP